MTMGKVICAGLGPGDPELMSVKSDRAIRGARHLAYFRKKGRAGQARRIVEGMLRDDVVEYAMEYPVTTELRFDSSEYRAQLVAFYEEWADRLEALARDHEVIVLCEVTLSSTAPSCICTPGFRAAPRLRCCPRSPAWWAAGTRWIRPSLGATTW